MSQDKTGVIAWLRSWFDDLYALKSEIPSGSIVDSGLSTTSTNAVQNKVITNALNNKSNSNHTHSIDDLEDWVDTIYPVGAIYMSVNNTNPSTLFGGTWQRLEDTFLYATSGTADTNSTTATGGSEDAVVVEHNHTQNAHNHQPNNNSYGFFTGDQNIAMTSKRALVSGTGNYSYLYSTTQGTVTEPNVTANTTATNIKTGVDGTGKNMPPYMKVYMWKRTA